MIKITIRSSYTSYRRKAKEAPVTKSEYVALTRDYNALLMKVVIAGHKVQLPVRFGTLEVTGRKQNLIFKEDGTVLGGAPDWKKTNEMWARNPEAAARKQLVYHTNSHSGRMRYKFNWSKRKVLVVNKNFYALVFTRANKRALAISIKNGKEY